MARKASFNSLVTKMAREAARAQRQSEQERQRRVREAERERVKAEREYALATRNDQRLAAAAQKEAQQRYLVARQREVDAQNEDLARQIDNLSHILEHTLTINDAISFSSLLVIPNKPVFAPPKELSTPSTPPDHDDFVRDIKKPSGLGGLLPSAKRAYEQALINAEQQFIDAQQRCSQLEAERLENLEKHKLDHERQIQKAVEAAKEANKPVIQFQQNYESGLPEAIIAYNAMVLERSEYPEGCPQEFRVAYVPDSKELVVEYELPGLDIIPNELEFKYIKSKDVVEEKSRKIAEIKELYQNLVAAIALRSVHEVLEADVKNYLEVVAFNGFVTTVDPATGRDVRPCLISLRTTRNRFMELDLRRIDKSVCLRNLGAQVSSRPAEMQPVKPIVEFSMVDKRFVEASDVLSDLESRPNLMELSPFEFENLVSNLFKKMGLETRQTRASRDGGVDCVAFDLRPILGGKVVIQAKRYSNTVGVSAVRDLYGTMMNEGANKGILVSTSGYGSDAHDFAKDKPIELIDGGGLLYLLEQNGVQARIVFAEQKV